MVWAKVHSFNDNQKTLAISDFKQDGMIEFEAKAEQLWLDGNTIKIKPLSEVKTSDDPTLKASALANIKVTVNGKEFDGHTEARANMGHAIMLAGITSQTSTEWKLADNTFATVTVAELQQALLLSLTKYGEIIGVV